MFDSYPQLNPVSLLKQLIYYPIRLLFAAIVEVHLWLFREKTLRIAILYNYPKRGHAKLLKFLIQKVASQRIGNIFSGMSQLELRKYISHVSWADEDGTFGHFEQYAKSEYGRHEDPESIKKEKLGSVIKHNFPVFFVFEYLLKNIESIVEYGSGDCRNYSYTKGNIAGGGRYYGIDISKASIGRAKRLYPENSERFVYVESLGDVFSGKVQIGKFGSGGAALFCYVLCHLTHDESRELLDYCVGHHDYLVIHDSLTRAMVGDSLKDQADLTNRHINYFEFASSHGLEVLCLFYHPICLSIDTDPFVKKENCAFTMILGRRGLRLGVLS